MERLLAGFSALGWREYLFAAGMAYVLTYIYRVFQRRKESGKNKEKTYVIQTFDKRAIDRCKELFPIDVLSFKGKEFKRGMQIRITTIQQNVIVGEFIGLNRVNLVCIKTGNRGFCDCPFWLTVLRTVAFSCPHLCQHFALANRHLYCRISIPRVSILPVCIQL